VAANSGSVTMVAAGRAADTNIVPIEFRAALVRKATRILGSNIIATRP
jgi:hypothetical protein